MLCPGGDSVAKNGMMYLFLSPRSKGAIYVEFDLEIKDADGNVFKKCHADAHKFDDTSGLKYCVKYSKIVDYSNNVLNNGTLTVELHMKSDEGKHCLNFIPKNPSPNRLKMFMDEETSDVSSKVKGQGARFLYIAMF